MPDLSPAGVGSFLATLRTLPIWLLGGLAIAGYAVLFAPAFGGIDPTAFRNQWGIAAWIWAMSFSILTITRGLDAGISVYREHRKAIDDRRALRLVPHHHQCWWHLAKQQDDSFVSQIRIDVEAANLTDRPVRILKVRLIRPRMKGALLHADVTLPKDGSPYYSNKHAVPPHGTVKASVHVMVRGRLAPEGVPLRVTLGITDQFGEEYRLKGLIIPTPDSKFPRVPWRGRFALWLRNMPGFRPRTGR